MAVLVFRLVLTLFLTAVGATLARAHPHVLVSVEAAFLLDDQGRITGIRHHWTFDEAYSAYAVVGLKPGKDGKIARADLEDLAKTNIESLQDFSYFTVLKQGKTALAFENPKPGYYLEHTGKELILHFDLPLKQPVQTAKSNLLEITDDSYFVAFAFAEKDPVRIEGPAGSCTITMKRPGKSLSAGELLKLPEGSFNNQQTGFADQYASNARMLCP